MTPTLIDIDYPRGWPAPSFYCPACGVETLSPERGEALVCEHLLYVFLYDIADFAFVEAGYEATFEKVRRELAEGDDEEALYEVGEEQVLEEIQRRVSARGGAFLSFRVTTKGFACGPVSQTLAIGLSMTGEKIGPAPDESEGARG